MTGYAFGTASLAELQGVHPLIVGVVRRAIQITEQDFGVHDGLRTESEQRAYVQSGVSQTMNSMHRKQADGYGHAVDLVPYINGKWRWEWPPIYHIAAAVRQACVENAVPLRWGGCWRSILDIPPGAAAMEAAVNRYGAQRRLAGRKAFTDGPHFELPL
jgi:peptidoglycan L-alanyl-D-glutamate endopeptidase CwlK